jgi:hypothetical protein
MIPAVDDPKWRDLILGKNNYHLHFLAFKILMSKIQRVVKLSSDEMTIKSCISEVHKFCEKNEKFLENDLKEIFG